MKPERIIASQILLCFFNSHSSVCVHVFIQLFSAFHLLHGCERFQMGWNILYESNQ